MDLGAPYFQTQRSFDKTRAYQSTVWVWQYIKELQWLQIPSNGCLGLKHENVKMIYSNWLTGLGWPRAITIWVGEPRLGVYALDSYIVWPISNHLCLVSLSMDLSSYKSRRKRSCLPYRLDNCLVNKYICGWIVCPTSQRSVYFLADMPRCSRSPGKAMDPGNATGGFSFL